MGEIYDIKNRRWIEMNIECPMMQMCPLIVVVNDIIYYLGGDGKKYAGKWDILKNEHAPIVPMLIGRQNAAAVVL